MITTIEVSTSSFFLPHNITIVRNCLLRGRLAIVHAVSLLLNWSQRFCVTVFNVFDFTF